MCENAAQSTEMQPHLVKLQHYSASFGQNSTLFGREIVDSCAGIGWFSQAGAQLVCNEMQGYDDDDYDDEEDDHDDDDVDDYYYHYYYNDNDDDVKHLSMQSGVWWWMDNNEHGMRLPLCFIMITIYFLLFIIVIIISGTV